MVWWVERLDVSNQWQMQTKSQLLQVRLMFLPFFWIHLLWEPLNEGLNDSHSKTVLIQHYLYKCLGKIITMTGVLKLVISLKVDIKNLKSENRLPLLLNYNIVSSQNTMLRCQKSWTSFLSLNLTNYVLN